MKISDGRINFLARQIAQNLIKNGLIDGELDEITLEVKKGFNFFLKKEVEIDEKCRKKIESIKRGVPEGSQEWDILYRQYYNEELEKV